MQHVTPNLPRDETNLGRNAAQMPPNLHVFGLPTPEPTPLYHTEIQPINPQKCRCVGFFEEKLLGAYMKYASLCRASLGLRETTRCRFVPEGLVRVVFCPKVGKACQRPFLSLSFQQKQARDAACWPRPSRFCTVHMQPNYGLYTMNYGLNN